MTDGNLEKIPSPLEELPTQTKAEKDLELLAAENLKHEEHISGTLSESSSESEASGSHPDTFSVRGKMEDEAHDETAELTTHPSKQEGSELPVQNGMVDEMTPGDKVVQNGFYNSSSDENSENVDPVRRKLPVGSDKSSDFELDTINRDTSGTTNQLHFSVSEENKELFTFEGSQKKAKPELFDKHSEQENAQDIIEEDFNLDSLISDATSGYESLSMPKTSDFDHEIQTDRSIYSKHYDFKNTEFSRITIRSDQTRNQR